MKKVATQVSPRTLANRRNGALGGLARARKHKKKDIAAWGAKGGNSTLAQYGRDFFSHVQSKRKIIGQYRTPKQQAV